MTIQEKLDALRDRVQTLEAELDKIKSQGPAVFDGPNMPTRTSYL